MIFYYQNPKTRDLIIYDSESEEILIVGRITNIKFLAGKDVFDQDGELGAGEESGEVKKKIKKARHARITPEMIEKILQMRADGKVCREIAIETGISEASIWKYIKRKQKVD